ncbi:hypothetical protein CDD83_10299 [Cordyceps sp. RAO-2017]|nr:hypothetical protein CDD83_10299 [Cordyceps sp. RAO-2017]
MDKVPRDQVVLPTEADLRNGLVMDASGPVLPSWSNTGFLELSLSRPAAVSRAPAAGDHRWPLLMRVERVNSTCHLRNLSRTRGGIGSAPYDDRQRTLTHFFAPAPKDSRGRR